ncbi:hypothetical protein BCR34DRAFT_588855 [Clohesyomyces aquaticus]|uniref:Uncharacterized protein n=1 Tax=Clohesyomyces aquaticus TaxID=1231657 RepID=A0A1Y1ZIQ9_9PLEO|nr:hypothetical protein BCR34DRAFT_588855 [Clohesyomyces aquaticus]
MTNREIKEGIVRQFARGIQGYRLHRKAYIICIFSKGDKKPARCSISVRISVFARSPHAAFLFSNVNTRETYILQTKGCFSGLLPHGAAAPRLGEDTAWDDLPQTSFKDLSQVHIPPSIIVRVNEVVLQDNTQLDIGSFLQDLPKDEDTIAQILDDEETLNTIAVTAKLQQESNRLRPWLDRLDAKFGEATTEAEPAPTSAVQVSSEPRSTKVTSALSKLDFRDDSAREEDDHDDNPGGPPDVVNVTCNHTPHSSLGYHERRDSLGHMRRMSLSGLELASDNLGRPAPFQFGSGMTRVQSNGIQSAPGFTKSRRQGSQFYGISSCMGCTKKGDVYCLLLRAVPTSLTAHFPSVYTHSIIQFPLAMGNYAKTNILSSSVVYNACAARYDHQRPSKHDNTIVASLPLVSYSDNHTAWLGTINVALSRRFHVSQLPIIFLSILYIKLKRLVSEEEDKLSKPDLCDAIKWTANMLLSEVVLQPSRIASINNFSNSSLHAVLLQNFRSTRSNSLYTKLLQYPLDRFIVANAALSNWRPSQSFSSSNRKLVVFLKFLYHLTKSFVKFRDDNDDIVTRAARSLVLLNNKLTSPSLLFK